MKTMRTKKSQAGIFVATRTGRKGKELDLETQAIIVSYSND